MNAEEHIAKAKKLLAKSERDLGTREVLIMFAAQATAHAAIAAAMNTAPTVIEVRQ